MQQANSRHLSRASKNILDALLRQYDALPGYKKIWFLGRLRDALEAYRDDTSLQTARALLDTFCRQARFFQRWFSFVSDFLNGPLAKIFQHLNRLNGSAVISFQRHVHNLLSHRRPLEFEALFFCLNSFGLLTGQTAQNNIDELLGLVNPHGFGFLMASMRTSGVLKENNAQYYFDQFINRADLLVILRVHNLLFQADLLTETNRVFDSIVITYANIFLHEDMGVFWDETNFQDFTLADYRRMINICQRYSADPGNARERLQTYVPQAAVQPERTDVSRYFFLTSAVVSSSTRTCDAPHSPRTL